MSIQYSHLNKAQQQFLNQYKDMDALQILLQQKAYDEIPHFIDYLSLVVAEIQSKMPVQVLNGTAHRLDLATLETIKKQLNEHLASILQEQKEHQNTIEAIEASFGAQNEWTDKLRLNVSQPLTTHKDFQAIQQLCQVLGKTPKDAAALLSHFYQLLVKGKEALANQQLNNGQSLEAALDNLPHDWYSEPWYYLYVQYFGTEWDNEGNFETLKKMLDYLDAIGIKNIYILPHYESPQGDGGYDVSAFRPDPAYGGIKAFKAFMNEALGRGFRVATDLVFNHTSVEHEWFQQTLMGSSQYFNYYLKCPQQWRDLDLKTILRDEGGDLYLYLPEIDAKGQEVVSKRILIFPDVDKSLWLEKSVEGLKDSVLFYREFYPFQVDLDLRNPEVVAELFQFLTEEVCMGILGKRTDAIAHWIKKPGTNAKDLPETHALHALIKQFLKHLTPKAIILPEVVTHSQHLLTYAGHSTTINGQPTTSEGDALLDFQLQGMLREMVYFQKTAPLWSTIYQRGDFGTNTALPLVPIEHHDETYMGFIQEIEAMRGYLSADYEYMDIDGSLAHAKRGIIYKNGMSGGARYAECLNRDPKRIATAFFCLYMLPATPVIYYGSEIGAVNQWAHMTQRQTLQYQKLLSLLGPEVVGPGKAITYETCEDPRELQRGKIAATDFYEALDLGYPAIQMVRTLNQIRQQYSACRSLEFSHLDTYHESILGMVKYPDEMHNADTKIVGLANLSDHKLMAKIPLHQLAERVSINPNRYELLVLNGIPINEKEHEKINIHSGYFMVDLEPYDSLLIAM